MAKEITASEFEETLRNYMNRRIFVSKQTVIEAWEGFKRNLPEARFYIKIPEVMTDKGPQFLTAQYYASNAQFARGLCISRGFSRGYHSPDKIFISSQMKDLNSGGDGYLQLFTEAQLKELPERYQSMAQITYDGKLPMC